MGMELLPIGIFHCDRRYAYDAARQGSRAAEAVGTVVLEPGRNLEQGLRDLAGFERIWLLYLFHRNPSWKPLVRPPRGDRKVGVFASRAPHRPNPVGLSCVRLLAVEGAAVRVAEHDLLDGTPVLDIKPYLPYADSFPDARGGWVDELAEREFAVAFLPLAEEQLAWLEEAGFPALRPFLREQLASRPTDCHRKRLRQLAPDRWEIAYRTWRIEFAPAPHRVVVRSLRSGYALAELADPCDPYADKAVHRAFRARFPGSERESR